MTTKYFKNNPVSTMFFDNDESGLLLVNERPGKVEDFNPGIHKRVAEAIQVGRIIEIKEKEFKKFYADEEAGVESEETEEEVEEEETEEEVEEEGEENPLDALTKKEELITWAENQSFINEADLDAAKGMKKAKEVKAFLQELLDLEQN